ncbi:MAG: hypothetical protein NZ888_01400 [Candidatus Nitrosocaldus sp.]|nr:hypothetical protein [Candidatus Nitrosocaldus sp.]MDW7999753.1 hypothetical protein [Candidatus Nitrosocaldus sp.]
MNRLLARYPFVADAGDYLRLLDYRLEEFDEPPMSSVVDRATRRVMAAVKGIVYDPEEHASVDEEIVSFILACVMVKATRSRALYRRFALSEAKRAEGFLVNDLDAVNKDSRDTMEVLNSIFKGVFGVEAIYSSDDSTLMLRVEDYLRYSTRFHDGHWRLINRVVHKGYVHLSIRDAVRLVRDEIYALVLERLERIQVEYEHLPEALQRRVTALKGMMLEIGREEFIEPVMERRGYPPCIINILKALEQGSNPSHTARVLLATYMLGIGKGVDEVCELFRNAPDYNERVTRYQVEHLAGLRGNRIRYSCPSCSKVASQGLCFKSDECDSITNPLQFGRYKGGAGRGRGYGSRGEGVGADGAYERKEGEGEGGREEHEEV